MNKFSWSERLRYAFDNTMSKGPTALIGWLALLSALVLCSWLLAAYNHALVADARLTQMRQRDYSGRRNSRLSGVMLLR